MSRSGATQGARTVQERQAARLRAVRALAYESTVAEVIDALEQRGVSVLLLKGLAFARWLYDDPDERPAGDIDLLIPQEHFRAAEPALLELGFQAHPLGSHAHESSHHDVWIRDGAARTIVELHHTLFMLECPAPLVWRRLNEQPQTVVVAGRSVRVPSEAGQALVVALHAVHHGAAYPRPQEDLERALGRVDFATWEEAARLADELGGSGALAAGLQMRPAGVGLAERLGIGAIGDSRRLRLLATTPPDGALGIERLVATPGLSGRATLLRQELVPSPGFMREWYPIARRGRLGLALSYAWRPFDLMLKLPHGLRAWLRAATASRSGKSRT